MPAKAVSARKRLNRNERFRATDTGLHRYDCRSESPRPRSGLTRHPPQQLERFGVTAPMACGCTHRRAAPMCAARIHTIG